MGVRETSIQSYYEINLSNRQKKVLNYICMLVNTNARNLAVGMGDPINCITGRVKELKKLNLIKETGKEKDPITNKNTIMLSPTELGITINKENLYNELIL